MTPCVDGRFGRALQLTRARGGRLTARRCSQGLVGNETIAVVIGPVVLPARPERPPTAKFTTHAPVDVCTGSYVSAGLRLAGVPPFVLVVDRCAVRRSTQRGTAPPLTATLPLDPGREPSPAPTGATTPAQRCASPCLPESAEIRPSATTRSTSAAWKPKASSPGPSSL